MLTLITISEFVYATIIALLCVTIIFCVFLHNHSKK